ncbi:MAG: C40 family peptidase [Alcaligenaceae bacterium]|jgi:cell wall-associated NlpC family hydrolase|nr:C40 family peptidase [Alcaligenaceae bacterium]
MFILNFAKSRGFQVFCQKLFVSTGLIAGLTFSNVSLADNQRDAIGDLITKSNITVKNSISINNTPASSEWRADLNDPIGQLINQTKADLGGTHASLQLSTPTSASSELAQAALNYLGVRYRFGGTSPSNGFDCSGLIHYIANKHLGMDIPRVAASQARIGTAVSRSELQPGDLVFFNTRGARNSHVGVYLGNNEFVHAPRTGAVVRVEKISSYWDKRWNGARRLSSATTHF